jgi:hypothetical protein
VLALATGQTLRDAALAVGIDERRKAKKTVESAQPAGEEVEAVEVKVVRRSHPAKDTGHSLDPEDRGRAPRTAKTA